MHYKTVFLRGGTTDFELEARMKDRAIYCLTFYMFQILSDPTCLCAAVESHNITKLHFMEQDLLQGLSNYINIMKENLVEYEDILSQSKQDILKQLEYGRRDYLGNPISVFRLVKRFSEGWGKLAKFIREDDPTFGIKETS
ncbi:uncharacterized protein LOC114527078 isoform X2 [Dendronephthya gigantea]|uniref:uncharacterized protein LOC114527078 isoform X2 n=1 Tax=Dendronephthya gigantea TaxID=151771 RepID=UPI00106A7E93|nr:uncharacterized protein LOC114527078 isoform X2 [Dendronephthya gigantea]